MSLKRPFVPKSDVKQWFTTTTPVEINSYFSERFSWWLYSMLHLFIAFWPKMCMLQHILTHLALSGLTVRLPVWPWQQVRLMAVRTGGGASNMNIHYDVTGLLTVVWRSHSGQIVWAAWIGHGGGGFWTHSTYTLYPGQLDRWRWY